jgi:hypothetical protein
MAFVFLEFGIWAFEFEFGFFCALVVMWGAVVVMVVMTE